MHAKNHKMRRKGTERERRQGKDKTRYFLKVSKLKKSYRGIEYDTRLNVPYIQTQERVFEEPLLAMQGVMTGGKYIWLNINFVLINNESTISSSHHVNWAGC